MTKCLRGAPGGGGTKFFRRGDLMKVEEERRRKEQERLDRAREEMREKKLQEVSLFVGTSFR